MKADIILPVTAANQMLWILARIAIQSCHATLGEYGRLFVLQNNTPDNSKRKDIRETCNHLRVRYEYIDGPYSNSRFWNYGTRQTDGEFIAWANQDCIYHHGWCDELIKGFWREPDYWALWPYSFHSHEMGLAYRTDPKPQDRIIETHHPATLLMMRREGVLDWDENLSFWEMDRTVMEYAMANKKKMGLCLNSRVDHFSSSIVGQIDFNAHFGEPFNDHCGRSKEYVVAKYGPT